MKKFIITFLIFLIGFFLVDKLLLIIRNSAPNREADKRLEKLYKGDINSNILILGSSRSARDIIASQLADSLKTTVENLGFPGSGVEFHDYLLTEIIKNSKNKPKLIILVVDDQDELISSGSRLNFRYDRLYPLVKYDQALTKLIEKGEKNYWLSKLFIVHQMSIDNFNLSQKHFKSLDAVLNDGSMPISFSDKAFSGIYDNHVSYYNKAVETEIARKSFLNIINTCNANNIKLMVCCPPNYYKPTIGFYDRINELVANKANLFIHDSINYPFSKEAKYYYDDVHLQKNGAVFFTNEVLDYIKKWDLIKNH